MTISYQKNASELTLFVSGDFHQYDSSQEKTAFFDLLNQGDIKKVKIESTDLKEWDSSLVVLLYHLLKKAQQEKIAVYANQLPPNLQQLLKLALTVDRHPSQSEERSGGFLEKIGKKAIENYKAFSKGLHFITLSFYSFARLFISKVVMRPVDFITALDNCGPKALPIVALISFMVGLILAFVGAIQLKTFGAQIYVASLVTIGMIRIMGAVMVGIIMAGRTGASYAATIGTMQVNEELDALKTMGIPATDFLVLPRIMALVITMPILVMLSDFMGMTGGAFVSVFMLGIPAEEYWKYAWEAFGLTNFLVGIFHGFVFGFIIALCGCYYGIYCGRNADSVGIATTKAVVSAIVWMIVMTGIITFFCEVLGI